MRYGQSPLFLAAYHGRTEAVRLLAWAGAEVDARAHGGSTPALCALCNDHQGVLELLLALKALPPVAVPPLVAPKAELHHLGEESYLLERSFPEQLLDRVERLFHSLPTAPKCKASSSERSYYCDSENWLQKALQQVLEPLATVPMPQMRFLHYQEPGGGLPPHVDLARTDLKGRRSSHTFILCLEPVSWDLVFEGNKMKSR